MPIQDKYYDDLFAYSLGCLDEEDLNIFEKYLRSGGDFAWQELGEYQNLASLLPSILNIETPPPQLKDNVARNLYRIRNEKRLRRSDENRNVEKSQGNIQPGLQHSNDEPNASKLFKSHDDAEIHKSETEEGNLFQNTSDRSEIEEYPYKLNTITDGFEVVSTQKPNSEFFRPIQETQIQGRDTNRIIHNNISAQKKIEDEENQQAGDTFQDSKEEHKVESTSDKAAAQEKKKTYTLHGDFGNINKNEKEKKKSSGVIVAILLLIIVAAGIAYVYYKISSDVKYYKANVAMLNNKIQNLSSNISANRELEVLLQSKNVRVINLLGTQVNSNAYGKLIISFDNSKGFLQFSNMPMLPNDKAYQLWIVMKDKFSSLGVFNNVRGSDYFSFTLPEITSQDGAKFIVSQEPADGSIKPGKIILLTGSL
ncbi:MAG: anti-sigma factor [Ignavibacteriaceae bacterium]